MTLLTALLIAAQAPAADAATALGLFEAACIKGQASLHRDVTRRVLFRQLPVGARQILRYALSPEGNNMPGSSPVLRGSQAPTQIYRFDNLPNTYLLLPDQLSDTDFSNVCALITRGDQFDEAARLVMGGAYTRPKPESRGIIVLPYVSTFRGGYRLSAARFAGWTLASTVPEEFPIIVR